jgi:hypothetical protein
MRRYKALQKLVDLVLPGYTIVLPAYEDTQVARDVVSCGSGPERAMGWVWDNPAWHRNTAANEIAIAKWLEVHGA